MYMGCHFKPVLLLHKNSEKSAGSAFKGTYTRERERKSACERERERLTFAD
jgi:hypothetical protein